MTKTFTYQDLTTPSNEAAVAVAGGSLAANTTYYYRLVGTAGVSTSIYAWYGKTKSSQEFSATTDDTNKSIELSFDMPEGEVYSYKIFRSTTSDGMLDLVGCMNWVPKDSEVNVAGRVTLTDDGSYAATTGNSVLEIDSDCHGIMTASGSSETDKFCIKDFYEASEANGWGIVTKADRFTYRINCYLKMPGTEWWEDTTATIIFGDGIATGNLNANFGDTTYSSTGNLTKDGCKIIVAATWLTNLNFAELNAYRTSFNFQFPNSAKTGLGYCSGGFKSGIMKDCQVDYMRAWNPGGNSNCEITNCIFSNFDNLMNAYSPVINGMKCLNGSRIWQFGGGEGNVVARGVYTEDTYAMLCVGTYAPSTLTIIDSYIDTANPLFGNYIANNGFKYYDQFSYNLTVYEEDTTTGIENATITMYDNTEEVFSVTTDSDGNIEEQYVTRYEGDATYPNFTYTNKSPFKITIEKDGYETYEENFPKLITEAVVKTISLKPVKKIRGDIDGNKYFAIGAEDGSNAKLIVL